MLREYFVSLLVSLMVFYPCFDSFSYAAINEAAIATSNANLNSNSPAQKASEAQKSQVQETYGKLPLYFTKNDGQVDKRVKFYEKGGGHATFFTKEGVYLTLVGQASRLPETKIGWATPTAPGSNLKPETPNLQSSTIKLIPLNANKSPEIIAEGLQEGKVNYFTGNDSKKWKKNIATYKAVVYKELYKGIDMKFYGNNSQMEYDIVVKPGADPSKVRLSYEGIEGLKVKENGELEISLKEGKLHQKKPYVYQEIDGKRVVVEGRFQILNPRPATNNQQFAYGFKVASYNKSYPLTIDPVLVYSTYLGGSSNYDSGYGIAVDSSGSAYVTGFTYSNNFPVTNSIKTISGPDIAIFVTKLDATGTKIIYSTIVSGNSSEQSYDIAVDMFGNAYVTGYTYSNDFPTVNAFQPKFGGSKDTFVFKLNVDGSTLLYSTYLGGSNWDNGYRIAVDTAGNAYITGDTWSRDFPTINAFQSTFGWNVDAFVTKLNPDGACVFSTYLGSADEADYGIGIAVDALGYIYVTGETTGRFPIVNALQSNFGGGWCDAFVTKFAPDGRSLIYSTYIGGNSWDFGFDIAIDTIGNIYVSGNTWSADFPTVNAFQATNRGNGDIFVTKIDSSGSQIIYSTYIGGSGSEGGNLVGIAVDALGNAYLTGSTSSTDFPIVDAFQTIRNGSSDIFVTKLKADGGLSYSTYLGGSGGEASFGGIAVDAAGNAYITGYTYSTDFPIANALQVVSAGGVDAFVTKIGDLTAIAIPPSLIASDTPCDNGGSLYLNWTLSPDDGSKVSGYRIYRSATSGGTYDLIGNVGSGIGSYTDSTAITGTTYYYVVRATDGTNESANSNEASAASIRNLPLPPTSVIASDTPYDLGGSISLIWTKSVDDGAALNNVLSYNIYRYSSTNGSIAALASVPAGSTNCLDKTTVDTDTYYYFIKALDNQCNMESTASDIASAQSINNMNALPGFIETLPGISPELLNSTKSKVENTIASLDRGNETAAINTLNALLNEIDAQSGKKIDTATADILKTYIQNLTSYIQSN